MHPWDEISLKVMNKAGEVAGQELPGGSFITRPRCSALPRLPGGRSIRSRCSRSREKAP